MWIIITCDYVIGMSLACGVARYIMSMTNYLKIYGNISTIIRTGAYNFGDGLDLALEGSISLEISSAWG